MAHVSPPSRVMYRPIAGPVGPKLLKLPVPAYSVRPLESPGANAIDAMAVDGYASVNGSHVGERLSEVALRVRHIPPPAVATKMTAGCPSCTATSTIAPVPTIFWLE